VSILYGLDQDPGIVTRNSQILSHERLRHSLREIEIVDSTSIISFTGCHVLLVVHLHLDLGHRFAPVSLRPVSQ
jgi:hypothetical protein